MALLCLIFASSVPSLTQSDRHDIDLYDSSRNIKELRDAATLDADGRWAQWESIHGNWDVTLDAATRTPALAYGKPVSVPGYNYADRDNALDIAKSFINRHQETLNVNPAELKKVFVKEVAGKYYVHFVQTYGEYEVLDSEVSIRINGSGQVFAYKVTFYNDIDNTPEPTVTPEQAINFSAKDIELKKNKHGSAMLSGRKCDDTKYILPIRKASGIEYRPVYKTEFRAEGIGHFKSKVDARTGEVLSRRNMFRPLTASVETAGKAYFNPIEEESEVIFSGLAIPVGDTVYYTDREGKIDIELDEPLPVEIPIESKHCRVRFPDGTRNSLTTIKDTLTDGINYIRLDDSTTNCYERFAIYHIEHLYNFMLELDPDLTCLENKMTVEFREEVGMYGVNAYSAGDTIAFVGYLDRSRNNFANSASVLYHEYGHSVNTLFYQELGTDMNNLACHEALADINSALLLDNSIIGYGTRTQDTSKYIRNVKNNCIYPDSTIGESHHDSRIMSGAFWDLREMTSIDYVAHLTHYARYGLPDDPDTGVAFTEWLMEMLMVDDDNGDLSDLTPNYDKIMQCFNRHQIGEDLLAITKMQFRPLDDVLEANIVTPTIVRGESVLPVEFPEDMNFVYSFDNFRTKETLSLPYDEQSGTYYANLEIPGEGALIRYYIADPKGNPAYFKSDSGYYDYCIAAGVRELAHFDFETDEGITIEHSDDINNGFVIDEPEYMAISPQFSWMPKSDVSLEGTKCLKNTSHVDSMRAKFGGAGYSGGLSDVLPYIAQNKGKSVMTTDPINVSDISTVFLSFYLHNVYADNQYGMGVTNAEMTMSYSIDGSENWQELYRMNNMLFMRMYQRVPVDIEKTEHQYGVWRELAYKITGLDDAETIRFRLEAENDAQLKNGIIVCLDEMKVYAPLEASKVAQNNSDTREAMIYPNPSSDVAYLDYFNDKPGNTQIELFSPEGIKIASLSSFAAAGQNTIDLTAHIPNFDKLTHGCYFVRIYSGTGTETLKLMITE